MAFCLPAAHATAQTVMPESAAGRLIMASGHVLITGHAGTTEPRPGKAGDWLHAGQLISTGSDGRAQIRFSDGALISLQPASTFRIDQYRFSQHEQRGFYSLLEGTIRAISGRIGKKNSEDFRLSTPAATIGIRGTEFIVQHHRCAPVCAPGQQDGLSVAVTQGRVFVYNAAGTIELPAGRATHVASSASLPVRTASKPVVSAPPTREEKREEKARAEKETADKEKAELAKAQQSKAGDQKADSASDSCNRAANDDTQPTTTDSQQPAPLPAPITPALVSISAGEMPSGALRLSMAGSPWTSGYRFAETGPALLLDDKLQLQRVGVCDSGGAGCLQRGTAFHGETGAEEAVIWGRWHGGTVRLQNLLTDLQSVLHEDAGMHWVAGVPTPGMPTEGSARYELVGATAPTFARGTHAAGSFTGQGLVEFGPGTGTRVALDGEIRFGDALHYRMVSEGAGFDASNRLTSVGDTSLRMSSTNTFSGELNVQSLGAQDTMLCEAGGCRATVDGAFFGEGASRLGFTYEVGNPQLEGDTDTINGAAVMGRVQP